MSTFNVLVFTYHTKNKCVVCSGYKVCLILNFTLFVFFKWQECISARQGSASNINKKGHELVKFEID